MAKTLAASVELLSAAIEAIPAPEDISRRGHGSLATSTRLNIPIGRARVFAAGPNVCPPVAAVPKSELISRDSVA